MYVLYFTSILLRISSKTSHLAVGSQNWPISASMNELLSLAELSLNLQPSCGHALDETGKAIRCLPKPRTEARHDSADGGQCNVFTGSSLLSTSFLA